MRIVFVLLALFLNVRYLMWRTFETLIYETPVDLIGMGLTYAAEVYAIGIHILGIFANIWPQEHKIMPLPEDASRYPSVDVFIPTYNESVDLVRITATAAANIDYPKDKLHVHILDDGATVAKRAHPDTSGAAWERHDALRGLARELGAHYITRERNIKAKAGNLNHAFTHTTADLILVLDADHVPSRDILKTTVGWFLKDKKLAFVQTPHFFINTTPVEKTTALVQDMPCEGDLFYRANHPGMNFWNSSFFCGSAAILRRTALEEVGGISGETITEDCETALALHRLGYNSVYISRPMVCGLNPETFDDFILQRSRWAQGMTQIFLLTNPLFIRGLKLYQRLCYVNCAAFWFLSFSRLIFYIAPVFFLLFGMHVYYASVTQVLAYSVPHLLGSILLGNLFYGKYRWPFISELYEGVQSLFLMPVVFSVLANPRKPSFKVTPKGKRVEDEFISGQALPFFAICALLLVAILAAIVKWFHYPLYRDVLTITTVWCLFNFALSLAAFGAFFERRQVRRHHRIWARGKLMVFFPRLRTTVEASLEDMALTGVGLSFHLPYPIEPQEHVVLDARDSFGRRHRLDATIRRSVKKGDRFFCGAEFAIDGQEQFATAVSYVYGDSQRWVDYWARKRKTVSPFTMLGLIGRMAVTGGVVSGRTFWHLMCRPILRYARRAPPKGQAALRFRTP
jgi:cellulose synthase (UDP-forming)